MQPGVANIYSSIAESQPGAPDFHLRECGQELQGRAYQQARRSYTDAVVRGRPEQGNLRSFSILNGHGLLHGFGTVL
jgi:hypothetical protein